MLKKIYGAWKLKEFILTDTNGKRHWRNGAHGLLIYNKTGHMSVSINSELNGESLIDSVLFYAGTFSVEGSTVRHLVLNATDLNRIGKEMLREANFFDNGVLELVACGDYGKAKVVWEKLTEKCQ